MGQRRFERRQISRALRGVIEQLESRMLMAVGPDGYGYVADAHPFENIDLDFNAPGVQNGSFDLGDNTFNFYGHTFATGRDLFLNPNGLITFGGGTSAGAPSPLAGSPFPRGLMPLWSNFRETHHVSVFAKLENTGGPDARPERLIVEWFATPRSETGATGDVTFQAILELNTGDRPGDIIFNYVDLESANPVSTVGMKDVGYNSNRMLIAQNDVDTDLVGEGKAIRIRNTATGQPIARTGRTKFQDEGSSDTVAVTVDASPSVDPNQSSDSLTYAWDLDLDGVYGESGAGATRGEENGRTTTFVDLTPGSGRKGPASYPIALRVTDASGVSSFGDGYVAVRNVRPAAPTVSGPDTAAAGVPVSFDLAAVDPGNDLWHFQIDWGDASVGSEVGATATATHTYYVPGTHTITVTAIDVDRARSTPVTKTVTVGALPDLLLDEEGVLMVSGTAGDDTITLDQDAANVRLTRNGTTTTYPIADVTGFAVDAGAGNDTVNATAPISITVVGGDGNDTLSGTGSSTDTRLGMFIFGGDGDDDITAESFANEVHAGEGNNRVNVNGGVVTTGSGDDVITAQSGRISSGDGNDSITTGSGSDTIDCGNGADTVSSGALTDRITAGGDPVTGIGAQIDGGDAPDFITAVFATTINGGEGEDRINVGSALEINGGDDDDVIRADVSVAAVNAGAGNDLVRANSSAAGPAVVFGNDGDDSIFTGAGPDSIYGGAGRDRIQAGSGSDLLNGGGGHDLLFGEGGSDRLYGGAGKDRLFGQRGNDRFLSGAGSDRVDGGAGADAATDDDEDELLSIEGTLP